MGPHPESFCLVLVLHMHKYKVCLELVFYVEDKHWLFQLVKHQNNSVLR